MVVRHSRLVKPLWLPRQSGSTPKWSIRSFLYAGPCVRFRKKIEYFW